MGSCYGRRPGNDIDLEDGRSILSHVTVDGGRYVGGRCDESDLEVVDDWVEMCAGDDDRQDQAASDDCAEEVEYAVVKIVTMAENGNG